MESITNLLGEVVKKIGGGLLAFLVFVGILVGGAVYAFQLWNEKEDAPAPSKVINNTVDKSIKANNTGGNQNINNGGDVNQTF